MSKRIPVTPQLQQKIRDAVNDPELDASSFAVYEARFLSSEAITQAGFYNKARVSPATLSKMAQNLSAPGSAVALQVMHDTRVVPIGKVFAAETNTLPNGETELRGMFYIPPGPQEDIFAAKIDNSTIDEVSAGVGTEHILCSECGFDFKGADADIMNFFTMTCGEGHVIGENGVHVRLTGEPEWHEQSLVNKGAAKNAKIFARSTQTMSKELRDKLAASSSPSAACLLFTSYAMTEPNQGETSMSVEFAALMAEQKKTVSELAEANAQLTAVKASETTLKAEVGTLTASLKEANDKIAELTAAAAKSNDTVKAELAETQEKLKLASEKMLPHVKAALIASGVAEADVPTDLVAGMALIEEKGLKLHQIVGAGATADGTKAGADEKSKAEAEALARRKGSFKL